MSRCPSYLCAALAFFFLLGAAPAFAQHPTEAAPPAAEQPASPQAAFIQDLGNRAIDILKDATLSTEDRHIAFRNLLIETFDLETIARFVLGRAWLGATPEQKAEYLNLFETLVIKTYADRFSLYTGEGLKVRSATPEGSKDFIVDSEITRPDGTKQTAVSWRVRQRNDKMGIIDVVVEGVSMSVTQRQEYASIIERNGGNLSALIDMMRQRVQRGEGVKEK